MSFEDGLPGFSGDDLRSTVRATSHDYDIIPNPIADNTGIELTTGEFKGVKYFYGQVSVKEIGDSADLSYTFEIIDPAGFDEKYLKSSRSFETHLGDVLINIIQTTAGMAQIGFNNSDTNAHSEPSDK